tara:strand:+ start:3285 stop:4343 length:1059 start_codon:yes stop_codon:yes gene_type:complete
MAFKKYAYYNKGNKIAVVEESTNSTTGFLSVAHCTIGGHSNKDDCEAAGGQWIPSSGTTSSETRYEKYTSANESVSKAIQIEYSYAPTFNLQSTGTEGSDLHKFIGWGSDGTNLVLFTYGATDVADLSSLFAVDDWIYIKGSGRWSGLHQVKSTGSNKGVLTLKTKCNLKSSVLSAIALTFSSEELATGHTTPAKLDLQTFINNLVEEGGQSYYFIQDAVDAENNGIFSSVDNSNNGTISFGNKITLSASTGEYVSTAAATAAQSNDSITIYQAFYEQITVLEGVDVMEDEEFELDLSNYQAQAVVYYIKAKLSEELRDVEGREYFMRLFKKQIEKGASSRKRGPYIMRGFM